MNKRVLIFLFLILNLVLIMSLISATLSVGNLSHSIEKKYGLGQNLIGWINVSASDENANSVFKDSDNNQISLINLLKLNPSAIYSCSPINCEKDYSASNGETAKQLLQQRGTKSYGMLFSGIIESINSISFNVSASGIPASCSNQLEIDFLDDGVVDFSNTAVDNEICPGTKSYACYNSSVEQSEYVLTSSFYCQRITLPKAPGFRLGAWIKNESGVGNVTLSLYDNNDDEKGSCKIQSISASGGEVSCDVNYLVRNPEAHYVCISTQGTGYKIKGYEASGANACGFYGYLGENPEAAYNIYAEAKKFGSFQSINVTDMVHTEELLSFLAWDYIGSRNGNVDGNLNCLKGCVVPIKFATNFTTGTFSLNINNIQINSQTGSGIPTNNKLYELAETNATVSSGFVKLDLGSSGLRVKNSEGNYTYNLTFKNQNIFSERLTVQKAPIIIRLTPLRTTYAFPTKFELKVNSSRAISGYDWDFGDGSNTTTTTSGNIIHIYGNIGDYDLKIVARDINNITSTRIYKINVTSPELLINSTLQKMKKDLSNLRDQIDDQDPFYRAGLNEALNMNNLSLQVTVLENRYKNASGGDYLGIVSDLLEVNIPEDIIITKSASNYIFYPEKYNINLDVVGSIEEKDTSDISTSSYADAVYSWNAENINNRVMFKEFSVRYLEGETTEPVLKIFDFSISEKSALNYNSYFLIKNIANLKFKEDYDETEIDGYTYIELTGGTKKIMFSTTEDVNINDLPAFIAPPLSKLSVIDSEILEEEEDSGAKWQLFGLIMLLLLLVGVVTYIILQTWYKRKYEDYLFKNKNDLYNLLHYIEAQRKKGVHESEIHYKLKNSGWNSEQIKYATRKHSGLRTGMLEIPIEKVFKKIDEKDSRRH